MWILDEMYDRRLSDIDAVVSRDGRCTFRQLWDHSEQIAREILAFEEQTGRNTPIVLYGDKHHDMITTMIAALKSGRAYVPVDVSYPIDRLEYISRAVNAVAIYNFSGKKLPPMPAPVRDGTALEALYAGTRQEDLPKSQWVQDEDICYILFTSGSTGKPKGVPISKSNLLNFGQWMVDFFHSKEGGQCVLNQASYSFDVSSETIYGFLASGKTLISVDKGLFEDIGALLDWLRLNHVAVWSSTPSFVDLCAGHPEFTAEGMPDLEKLMVGGEVFTKNTASYLMKKFPGMRILNTYGPTEATVEFVACEVTQDMIDAPESIPIGQVMEEAKWWIEDNDGKRCASGEVGELVVVSKSVAKGYFNNPEQTAKAFLQDPDGRMGYRTGDLMFEKNGLLYFVGRKDFQVKVNGYRIETEDVANNLNKLEIVDNSVVIPAMDDTGKAEYLAAFVKLKESTGSKLKDLVAVKKGLAELVPAYMVPRKIFFVEEFPRNTNDKIDRKALGALLKG